MRRTPNIGSLDDYFDGDEDRHPAARRPRQRDAHAADAAAPQSQSRAPGRDAARTAVPPRNPADTISFDGMTLDEILALSDSPPPDEDEFTDTRDDTGEWGAIEDMLDPNVMLREGGNKK